MADQLTVTGAGDLAERESLARELADAYRRRVEFYRREYAEHWADVLTQREAVVTDEFARRALTDPPDQVSFSALEELAKHDPAAAQQAWERVKADARDELTSGHRAAITLEFLPNAWERAQFLAIRAAFIEQWQPANAGEALLVDTLAQTHHQYLAWVKQLTTYSEGEAARQQYQIGKGDPYELPRMSRGEAIDHASAMVDRYNRLFLRTLRALRDLRRYAPTVMIQNAGQVNIGQQVNVANEL